MAWRVSGIRVQVVDAVLVEGRRLGTLENVSKAWRVGEAEDAIPA